MSLIVRANHYEVIFASFYEPFWSIFVCMNPFFVYFRETDLMCWIWIEFFISASLGYLCMFDPPFSSRFKKVSNSVYLASITWSFAFFLLQCKNGILLEL